MPKLSFDRNEDNGSSQTRTGERKSFTPLLWTDEGHKVVQAFYFFRHVLLLSVMPKKTGKKCV